MRKIANVIWFIFGGLISALLWGIGGIVLCITIVGIPLGIQLFKFAKISFAPFGKKVKLNYMEHPIANTVWLIFLGWETFLVFMLAGLLCCITVVGIPVGIQGFKYAKLAFAPFGAKVYSKK